MADSNQESSVRVHPWVSYALAGVLLVSSLAILLANHAAVEEAGKSPEVLSAVTFFERNPEVRVSERFARFIGADHMAEVRARHEQRRQQGGVAVLSERMQQKTQKRFEEVQRRAFASLQDLASWRFGIVDGSSPLLNTFAHLAVNETVLSIGVSMLFLVFAALALEGAWGSLLFGGLCLLLPFATRVTYTSFYGDQGVPWAGASGMVAGLLGAYLVRSFRGFSIPGWLLLPPWIVLEYLLVRDLPIDSFDAAPFVVHAVSFAFGAAVAGAIWALDLEDKLLDRKAESPNLISNPVLERALLEQDDGNADAAFELLEAGLRKTPGNQDVAAALWQMSVGTERAALAVPAMLGAVREGLRAGRRDDACSLWMSISGETTLKAEGTLLVRIGEALLAQEEHDAALHSFALAVDGAKTLSSVLAIRVVRGARDLDPDLAGRAAAVALIDDQLGTSERASLQLVLDTAQATAARAQATAELAVAEEPAAPGVDASNGAAPASSPAPDLAPGPGPEDDPDPYQDPHAIDSESFAALGEGESLAGDDPDTWNQPGMVEDLSAEIADDSAGFDWSGLQDDREGAAIPGVETGVQTGLETGADSGVDAGLDPGNGAESVIGRDSSEVSETTETLDAGEEDEVTADELETRCRTLRARAAVPVALDDDGLSIEVEGGSKTVLPFARIEAVAAGAVHGLADRPVLVVDVILNWLDVPEEPLKVVRLRSDGFDPRSIVSDRGSALESLRAMLDQLIARSGATPLPGRDNALGNPFATFPDIESYNRDVLMTW